MTFFTSAQAADTPPLPASGESLTTADGVRFALWPKRLAEPAPLLFILSGDQDETLSSKYFRQAGQFLANEGVVCVSVDLPCHGQDARPDEKGLTGWRRRCDKGEDFVAEVTGRLSAVLDHLIKEDIADPERIAASGTSRGGFIATHFAIADARVKHVLAFAPLADLARITEFKGAEDLPLVQKLSLEKNASILAGRSLWLVIGDRDDRVSTESVVRFARAVTQTTLETKSPAAVDLHVIAEPRGHTVPAGYAELGAAWLRKKFDLPASK
ncbi:alpha/beta fold hydrolase [Prosthecobacter sp. SYSU 5D2]